MDLRTVVEHLLSPDQVQQKIAEQTLAGLLERELETTAARLSELVNTTDAPDILRQSASLAFKNAISSLKDPASNLTRQENWMKVSPQIRQYVKKNILDALRTDKPVLGRAIAQCIAHLTLCEIARGDASDTILFLTSLIQSPDSNNVIKQSSLEAIGYICEEVSFESVSKHSNAILTAIVSGMRKEEPSVEIRLAATTALNNSVDFFKENFEKVEERNYIMTVVCEATQAQDGRLKIAALQCLVKIIQFFYSHMQLYMQEALFPISCQAMQSDIPEVVQQGIEFWSTVCETEINLNFEDTEAHEDSQSKPNKNLKFVSRYLPYITPQLLRLLAQQNEHDEADEWGPSKAASLCLMFIAECVQDEIVPHVVPFISKHVADPDWHFRDSACVAFGSILDGPDTTKLRPLVDQAFDVILAMMADNSVPVRDSAAWVVQRMCQSIRESVMVQPRFNNTVTVLRQNLGGVPRVATNVCWALGTLAVASYEAVLSADTEHPIPETSLLSPMFSEVVQQLFAVALRPESSQNNLRTAAFSAIEDFVRHSPVNCYSSVQKTTVQVLGQLGGILENEQALATSDRHQYGDYCQHLFGVLQSAIKRLLPEDVAQIVDNVSILCFKILELHRLGRSFQAEPEALLCLQVIMELNPQNFTKFIEPLCPYIYNILGAHSEHSVMNSALAFLSELFRTYESNVVQLLPNFIDRILTVISSVNDPTGAVITCAIKTLGDIALSVGYSYMHFARRSFDTLRAVPVPQDVDVWIAILEAILDACTGILNGVKSDGNHAVEIRDLISSYAQFIIPLLDSANKQLSDIDDDCVGNCATLIGVLCETFGKDVLQVVDSKDFTAILLKGKQLRGTRVRTFCRATLKELQKLRKTTEGVADAHQR